MAAFCGRCGSRAEPAAGHCSVCGTALTDPAGGTLGAAGDLGERPWDPQVLGRYEPQRLLSRADPGRTGGSAAAVWLAHDTVLLRPVAIKILDLPDPAALEAIAAQLRAAATIQHPHAVAVYDLVRTTSPTGSPRALLVRQFVEGSPLTELLARRGPLSAGVAARLLLGPAEALAAAHRAGVTHRAITTDAILLDRAGAAKLADLGLGRSGSAIDDIRAFGAVLYAALGLPVPTPGSAPVGGSGAAGPLAPLLQRLSGSRDDELPDAAALARALAAVASRASAPEVVLPDPLLAAAPSAAGAPGGPGTSGPGTSGPGTAYPYPVTAYQDSTERTGAGAARRRTPMLVAAGAAVVVVALAFGGWQLLDRGGPGTARAIVTVTTTVQRTGGATIGTTVPGGGATAGRSTASTSAASFAAPAQGGGTIEVVAGSAGEACVATGTRGWGDYPMADCRMWQPSAGLTTGRALSKTDHTGVACQADLRHPNPLYAANQANSWWVWTQSDDGTWDWFPETAVSQGASGLPINGVALCQG